MSGVRALRVGIPALLAGLTIWGLAASAQQSGAARARPARFEFEVVESFDAKYLGDTPGHVGKGGGLGDARPDVALGDPVFRGNVQIGSITGLQWDRGRGSLEVEFDPFPADRRVAVGSSVWVSLNGALPAQVSVPATTPDR